TTTNSSGNYSFADVVDGVSYLIAPLMAHHIFDPVSESATIVGANNIHNFAAELVSRGGKKISGQAILDNLEKTPIAGVLVSNGFSNAITNSDGYFLL